MIVAKIAPFAFIKTLLFIGICTIASHAKESSGWFVGISGGYGQTNISKLYSDSAKSGGVGVYWGGTWQDQVDSHFKSNGVAMEAMVGYKHFLNDYIGLRYYANVGAQFYKDAVFSGDKTKIGVLDYTINADLLINFYDSESFSFGVFGGFGVGGAHFDSPEIASYENFYGGAKDSTQYTEAMYAGVGEVWRNFVNASVGAGVRVSFFQRLRQGGQLSCSMSVDGRRNCRDIYTGGFLAHSLEFSAKFPLLTYKLTTPAEVMGRLVGCTPNPNTGDQYICANMRHAYQIKTPYRFTLRYIIAF